MKGTLLGGQCQLLSLKNRTKNVAASCLLRPWLPCMYQRLSKSLRLKLIANSQRLKIAIKKVKKNGQKTV